MVIKGIILFRVVMILILFYSISVCFINCNPPPYPYSLDELIDQLNNNDPDVRLASVNALRALGPEAEEAIAAIINVLKDSDERVREASAYTLGEIGPSAEEAVPALIEALKDEDLLVRKGSIIALGKIGRGSEEAIPSLLEALKDEREDLDYAASVTLSKIGKEAVPYLVKLLGDDNLGSLTRSTLEMIGDDAEADLLLALNDENLLVRAEAGLILANIGTRHTDEVVRVMIPLLNQDSGEHNLAVFAIGKIGFEAVDPILNEFNNEDESIRANAAYAIRIIHELAKDKAIPYLIEALEDESYHVRISAIRSLIKFGSNAKESVPHLIGQLYLDHHELAAVAGKAIGAIGTDSTMPLIEMLKMQDSYIRKNAANALGQLGTKASDAVQPLIDILTDDDEGVRYSAVSALGSIGIEAKQALPKLKDLLKNDPFKNEWGVYPVRNAANRAINTIESTTGKD